MCGRYEFTLEDNEELRRVAELIEARYGPGGWQPGEIRPTATAPVLRTGEKKAQAELMRWGYALPHTLVINARAESVREKPLFRDAVAARRCVVPTAGFYEWDGDGRKYRFRLPGEGALYLAGLYEVREGVPCYCILTTAANPSMAPIHDRMPLVLTRRDLRPWLERPQAAAALLEREPPALEARPMDPQLRLW